MRQWVLRITDYADRLLEGLDSLDWPESVKESQRNWIGRSEGAVIRFYIPHPKSQSPNKSQNTDSKPQTEEGCIEVFTTRVDTLYGCTYVVVAPEHPFVQQRRSDIKNQKEVETYISETARKTEMERTAEGREKTGVRLDGIMAINPINGEEVPVFVADYVLGDYGTGAVMAVPAHDVRDFAFAKKYNLPVRTVVSGLGDVPFTDDGVLADSADFSGLDSEQAREKIATRLEADGLGKKVVKYKLRDWVFSRQRYWGEPIPLVHCEKCGVVPVPENELPVLLPDVASYEPTGTGESPLAGIDEWVNTSCPSCGGKAKRETNTMPQWAGSSWYYLRYIDSKNKESFVGKELEKKWMPVDVYVGGAEHATRHLIYARFWHKFLLDIGAVSTDEPFKKLINVGLILASDGRKMSKRWGNVVNPDDMVGDFGADAMRLYEMFMGPFNQNISWNTDGVVGTRRFLEKVSVLDRKADTGAKDAEGKIRTLLHKTIVKVTDDIDSFRFNTAVSTLMILVNALEKEPVLSLPQYSIFLKLLSPFAPHIAEELWEGLGNTESIFLSSWPEADPDFLVEDTVKIVVSVNGKVRDTFEISSDATEDDLKAKALGSEKIAKFLDGMAPKRIVVVPGKLVNIVV